MLLSSPSVTARPTHSAADIADNLPEDFVSNQLISRQDYIDALNKDKGQFLPDGMMPADGPATVLEVLKKAGKVKGPVTPPPIRTTT